MWKACLLQLGQRISAWMFWPATLLVIWGELTPTPPSQIDQVGDKWQHFVAYLGLAGMAVLAVGWRSRLIWVLAGIAALGGVLEILQGYTGRDPEFWDFVADLAGVAAGVLAGQAFFLALRPARLVAAGRDA